MSELFSPIRPQDNAAVFERLQTRLREMSATRQADAPPVPDVAIQLRSGLKILNEVEAMASMGLMQAEVQRGVDVAAVHKGLDPRRVAKLIGLLE